MRLALRRDRVVVPVWVLVLGVLPAAIAATYEQFYPDAASRSSLTTGAAANPSVTLLYGPAFDLSTAGGFTAWRILAFLSLFTALACVFTVTRHTRQEEDTGRQELLSSAVLGRFAALTAALLVAGAAALTTGLVAVITLVATGMPAAGSVAFGLGIASTGWVFSAVAAVTAQLVEYSRTANGLASAVLGLAFLVRGVGDSAKDVSWLSWLSPLGWAPQLRAFAGERWAVVLLPLAATVVLCGLAYGLLPRRDVGLSIFPSRPGPATAAPGLRSPLALAWRLHRGTLTGWLVGFAVMGAVLGSLASGIGGLVGDSPQIRQVFERMGGTSALVDSYLGAIAGIFGMVAAVFAVQANLRMRSEETGFRLEPLLATPVRRLRWAASHLVFSLLGSALLLVVARRGRRAAARVARGRRRRSGAARARRDGRPAARGLGGRRDFGAVVRNRAQGRDGGLVGRVAFAGDRAVRAGVTAAAGGAGRLAVHARAETPDRDADGDAVGVVERNRPHRARCGVGGFQAAGHRVIDCASQWSPGRSGVRALRVRHAYADQGAGSPPA